MIERYTLSSPPKVLEAHFKFELPDTYTPTYNAAPAQLLPVVTALAQKGFSYFYWATIPGWAGNKAISPKLIGVSSEEVMSRSSIRKLLRTQRCIVPADGFYLWKKVSKKSKIPHYVKMREGSLFSMAAVWEEFEENEQKFHTFRIIQSPAPEPLSELGDFVPIILSSEEEKVWLDLAASEDDMKNCLKPLVGGKFEYHTVSSRIENTNSNDPSLIKKVAPMDQFGNYSLFD